MKHLIILSSILLLVACSSAPYKRTCDSWLNQNANTLIRTWGYPTQSATMPNGNIVLVYVKSRTSTDPVITFPGSTRYSPTGSQVYSHTNPGISLGGGSYTVIDCKTTFEAEPSGRIVFYRFEGPLCQ